MLTPRLRQLLLLLSSNHDGEVLNAVHAIDRLLKAGGASWHDLVDGLAAESQPRRPGDESPSWREMRARCLQHPDRLREREAEFLESLGSWHGDLTEKQHGWLCAIYGRVNR